MRLSFSSMSYSYRVKYSGLLASLFLSSIEILGKLCSTSFFSFEFFVLVEPDLGKFSLRVFNLDAVFYDVCH
jgi:hypothetical protein